MATVSVVSIFTRGARSSETAEARQSRALNDVAGCNAVWASGFPGGWRCNIQFSLLNIIFREDVTIFANTVASVEDPRILNLIGESRAATNNAVAIYVVYLPGDTLINGVSNANGGPFFTFFNNINNYGLIGRAIMTDDTVNSYILAHEAGHCLFGQFAGNTDESWTIVDPSDLGGDGHNQNPQNIMFGSTPLENPLINETQCNVASQSRIVLENVQTNNPMGGGNTGSNTAFGAADSGNINNLLQSSSCCSCCAPHHSKSKIVKQLNRLTAKEIKRYGTCDIQVTPFPKKKCKHHKNKHCIIVRKKHRS